MMFSVMLQGAQQQCLAPAKPFGVWLGDGSSFGHAPHFGANFSRARAGRTAAFLVRVCLRALLWHSHVANGCSTQLLYSPSNYLSFWGRCK